MGAYDAAMFHVVTHAFFKALLFLGAGSVIHALGGEQDIRRMGGLRGSIRITYITFLIGTLAISGLPLLSGFFSKDLILAHAYQRIPRWSSPCCSAGRCSPPSTCSASSSSCSMEATGAAHIRMKAPPR
jgi:NADH:ubiquinone oxidoreductase subunit 5 (subunit L)/multisubunit Na+/H+ antiporter MnhA subunit